MKLQLYLTILFVCFITVYSGAYENLERYHDAVYEDYPHIACALCRGIGQGNCRNCPVFEDIPLCEFVEQYESFSNKKASIHNDRAVMKHLQGNCSSDDGRSVKFGHILDALQTDSGSVSGLTCIFCNVVIGLLDFVTNEILFNPELDGLLLKACDYINGCTPKTIEALLTALEASIANLYNVIGVGVFQCPSYPDFINQCFG